VLGDDREQVAQQLALALGERARDLVDRRRRRRCLLGTAATRADADASGALADLGRVERDGRPVVECAVQRSVLRLRRYRRPSSWVRE
jgi:hypothetical protein